MFRIIAILLPVLIALAGPVFAAGSAGVLNYSLSFEDLKFLDQDFVARSGLKSPGERGLELVEGRFGKGVVMNLEPSQQDVDNLSGIDLDLITAVIFNTTYMRESMVGYNEPILWGAGKVNPASGAISFWVRGDFREGTLFEQTACAWGRKERDLIGIRMNTNGCLEAYLVDARYVRHTIVSEAVPDGQEWNHVVLNWDRANGLELFLNGKPVASSWGKDPWWETALPGLLRFPMPRITYDEAFFFSRPLTVKEIGDLLKGNAPPAGAAVRPERTPAERDRLVRALGITPKSLLPSLLPAEPGKALSFREVTPEYMGDGRIHAHFCGDGRYELAWPHPAAVFTIIPGDVDFTAEKLDVDPPPGIPFNYITVEGNLTGLPVYTNCTRKGDRFSGDTLIAVPDSGGFFHGEMTDRKSRGRITLPFLKGYGAPEEFQGDVRLPLTGATRVHEVGLFDVAMVDDLPVPGELSYYLCPEGEPGNRYGYALNALLPAIDRSVLYGFRTPDSKPSRTVDTGLLRRTNLITAPLTGERCIGGITLDLPVKTMGEDLLLVRLRDPSAPSRTWTHAEVKLKGFEGSERRLRLRLEFTPLFLAAGDRVWLDIATLNNAKIRLGGSDGARIVLRPAPRLESAPLFERKALLPARAGYSRMFGYVPWKFDGTWPDFKFPTVFGGPFDILYTAQGVKRALPNSFLADFYLEFSKPEYSWGNPADPEKDILIRNFDIPARVPGWAYLQQKIQNFRYRVLEWIGANQNPDGQFGGGWNDDNDMLAGKLDMFLDGSPLAREIQARMYEGLDAAGYIQDGYCRITPIDRLHVDNMLHDRFREIIYYPGDPARFRRSLGTAWRWDKPGETPLNWGTGKAFLYDKSIVEWYWGKNIPQTAFSLTDTASVNTRLTRLASFCDERAFYQFTEARVYTDTQNLYDEGLITGMIIGGSADSTVSAEWVEGGGEDLARWITHADTSSFECRMYSFDPLQRKVSFRLFRLRPGTYEVKLSEDLNGTAGRALFTGDFVLSRFEPFSVLVPPAKPVMLTIRLVEPEGGGLLPDLALAGYDCIRGKDRLWVRVSNLGGAPSGKSALRLYDGNGREIAEQKLPEIPPPLDYVEKSAWVTFEQVPEKGKLRIVDDPQLKMREIYKGNNTVEIE
ncbi:MAG: LamG-like jellyroll fold domain-containing protein [Candidatus Latescibacterota bacterium]